MLHKKMTTALMAASCGLVTVSCSGRMRYEPIPDTGASLTGTVSYKKEKLTVGMVIVDGKNGGGTASIEPDGRYSIANVPQGEVTVAVNMAAARGQLMGRAGAVKAAPADVKGAAPKTSTSAIPNIPEKYTDTRTSPLKTTVNAGENKYDISID